MQMSYIEGKVYRILWNDSRRSITPTVKLLSSRTGRRPQEILRVLASLAKQDFIEWDPARPDECRLLTEQEQWDRQWSRKKST